ncbi:uncharacterized protein VNE69_01020 [Vairimorpha necatrix]|uniref:F-box domain-containing protein n=1 Tax=Vairimorpha necatrix TaxID=6039 RepID=A0AAX4J834_9MICR
MSLKFLPFQLLKEIITKMITGKYINVGSTKLLYIYHYDSCFFVDWLLYYNKQRFNTVFVIKKRIIDDKDEDIKFFDFSERIFFCIYNINIRNNAGLEHKYILDMYYLDIHQTYKNINRYNSKQTKKIYRYIIYSRPFYIIWSTNFSLEDSLQVYGSLCEIFKQIQKENLCCESEVPLCRFPIHYKWCENRVRKFNKYTNTNKRHLYLYKLIYNMQNVLFSKSTNNYYNNKNMNPYVINFKTINDRDLFLNFSIYDNCRNYHHYAFNMYYCFNQHINIRFNHQLNHHLDQQLNHPLNHPVNRRIYNSTNHQLNHYLATILMILLLSIFILVIFPLF